MLFGVLNLEIKLCRFYQSQNMEIGLEEVSESDLKTLCEIEVLSWKN